MTAELAPATAEPAPATMEVGVGKKKHVPATVEEAWLTAEEEEA